MSTAVNPDQFKLFMTGTEWQAHVTHSTDGPFPELWDQKLDESKDPHRVYDSMKERGYVHAKFDPPTIILEKNAPNGEVRRVQSQGHHRVAAAADLERKGIRTSYIPTNYVDNTKRGKRG